MCASSTSTSPAAMLAASRVWWRKPLQEESCCPRLQRYGSQAPAGAGGRRVGQAGGQAGAQLACSSSTHSLQTVPATGRSGILSMGGQLCCLLFCLQAELLLPWLHGFDHNMACQIAYSGLYRVSRAAQGWRQRMHVAACC